MSSGPGPASPPASTLELSQQVCYLLVGMGERLQQHFEASAAAHQMTAAQAKLLLQLQPEATIPMRELARRLRCDPSNLTGLVDKLQARDAVIRQPHPTDRRIKSLAITTEGMRLRESFWQQMTSDVSAVAALNAEQLTTLRDLLSQAIGSPSRAPLQEAGR